jgi:ABC-2 type transport system permease protein
VNTRLIRMELKLYLRDFAAVFFGTVLSPLIFVILGCIPAFRVRDPELGGQSVIGLYVPIMIAMAVAMIGLSVMPSQLATYRERGILRRLSTTPVRPRDLLVAQAAVQIDILLMSSALVVLLGRLAFGVGLPRNPIAFLGAFVLAIGALFGIGLMLACAPTAKLAAALGSAVFFPLMFLAGLWVPREVMPDALRRVSDFSPMGASVQSLRDASSGHWPQALHLAVLLVWTVAAWLGATRLLRSTMNG